MDIIRSCFLLNRQILRCQISFAVKLHWKNALALFEGYCQGLTEPQIHPLSMDARAFDEQRSLLISRAHLEDERFRMSITSTSILTDRRLRDRLTNLTNPVSYSIAGSIGLPLTSLALLNVNIDNKHAMASQTLASPRWRPGHILGL